MKVLEIPNLNTEQLKFIYRLHKTVEMKFALSDKLLGLDAGRSTAKEVEGIISLKDKGGG